MKISDLTRRQQTRVVRLMVEHGLEIAICPLCKRIAPNPEWSKIAAKCKRSIDCGDHDAEELT